MSLTRKDDGTNTYDYAYEVRTRRERSDWRGRRPHLMTDYDGPGTSNGERHHPPLQLWG